MSSSHSAPGSRVAVVLAAGRGTRMKSELTKVLHPFLGRAMVVWVVEAALGAGAESVVVVVGHQEDAVRRVLGDAFGDRVTFARQDVPRGTGHAVQCALAATEGFSEVAVLSGDTPALDSATLDALSKVQRDAGAQLTLTSMRVTDPTGYGRVVRAADGSAQQIVEHADADAEQRAIDEVNAGLYLFDRATLVAGLATLSADNAQGELYLTDVLAAAVAAGAKAAVYELDEPIAVAGINTRSQLAALEKTVLSRRISAWMDAGVTFQNPDTVRIEGRPELGRDVTIGPGVVLRGTTSIGDGAIVDVGCVLTDCVVGPRAHVRPYVVADSAVLGAGAVVGPYAHLRPGTKLGANTKIGNFVETKKAVFGDGSKASHLSYLGDCTIGQDVNIGAGTITCNYDGFDKHQTVLEDGVFIGSDTQLVAPVRVGANATIAAGTTVTRDVPSGALAISRSPQEHVESYYSRRRLPREKEKAAKRAARAATRTSDAPST